MARRARTTILYDGCFAHIFSRAIEKRKIFRGAKDFEVFQGLLHESKQRYGFRIFHYCLMHTHFHMVVGINEWAKFSDGLKDVKWKYTRRYNFLCKRWGPLWQERFKSLVIEDESYLRACGLYIERNPVEAGLVRRATDWMYSSSRYTELGQEDPLVDGYEWGGVLPDVKEDARVFFEQGSGIGSDLFRLYLKQELSFAIPVP